MDGSDLFGEERATVIPVLMGREGDPWVSSVLHQCCEQPSSAEGLVASFAFVGTITGPLKQTHNQPHTSLC